RWAVPASLELQVNDDWAGLHVTADWMDGVVAAFTDAGSGAQPNDAGDDPLRPKSWLHVSLAYGNGYDVHARTVAAEHASAFADLSAEGTWTVSLWRRDRPQWERLVAFPVAG